MKNKKNIMTIGAVILGAIIIILLILFVARNTRQVNPKGNQTKAFVPEFMGAAEKQSLSIPEGTKIQVLKRDAKGTVSVYKIINNDSDITDPATVKPISPR